MSNSEGVAVGCLIFIGLVPLVLSVAFTKHRNMNLRAQILLKPLENGCLE